MNAPFQDGNLQNLPSAKHASDICGNTYFPTRGKPINKTVN